MSVLPGRTTPPRGRTRRNGFSLSSLRIAMFATHRGSRSSARGRAIRTDQAPAPGR
ncbi:hypothetical protein [Streptomyces sp. SYSU K217416]